MFTNPRYLTRGINDSVAPELQLCMWHMIDMMNVEKDYLQVFELSIIEIDGINVQHIHHFQEVPPFSQDIDLIIDNPITSKIYVIDDGDHSTMLLTEEY